MKGGQTMLTKLTNLAICLLGLLGSETLLAGTMILTCKGVWEKPSKPIVICDLANLEEEAEFEEDAIRSFHQQLISAIKMRRAEDICIVEEDSNRVSLDFKTICISDDRVEEHATFLPIDPRMNQYFRSASLESVERRFAAAFRKRYSASSTGENIIGWGQ